MTVRPPLRTFASATLFAALCLAQPFALAQNGGNGKGTLTIEGEVTDSTCVINFKDATAGTQAASSSTLKLTAIKRADLDGLEAGAELTATPAKFTIVSLGNSNGSGCSLDNSNSFWDFEINAESTTMIGSKVLLSSVAADTGSSASRSNVLVQLKAKVIDNVNTVPTPDTSGASDVKPINSEKLGVQLSNASGLTATQGFAIGAVYVRPDGTPTAGSFSSPITLSVKYP
jgi:type 1 fimbria pilin